MEDYDIPMALSHRVRSQRATMLWVAARLRTLEALEPHAWDRATLRDLYHALEDSPRLCLRDDSAFKRACQWMSSLWSRFVDLIRMR